MYYPKVLKPRPLLFDLGDTLLNFSQTNPLPFFTAGARLAYDFLGTKHDLQLPFAKFLRASRRFYAGSLLSAWLRRREVDLQVTLGRLLKWTGLPDDDDAILELGERFYEPMKKLGAVEEGLHEVLDILVEQGHPMGIVSNTMVPAELLDRHLEDEGLLKYFPARIYSCEVGVRKPRAAIFLAGLRALNAKPQHTLFIGDRLDLDAKGASRLGMTTVLKVRKGKAPRGRFRPDHIIRHLTELPKLLAEITPTCYEYPPLLPSEMMPLSRFALPVARQAEADR